MKKILRFRIYKYSTITSLAGWLLLNLVYLQMDWIADRHYFSITILCILGLINGIYFFDHYVMIKRVNDRENVNQQYHELVKNCDVLLQAQSVILSYIDKETFEKIKQEINERLK